MGAMDTHLVEPDVWFYNSCIEAIFYHELYAQAKIMFETLARRGLQPNVYTYTVMIKGCDKIRMFQEADRYIREMLKTLRPDEYLENYINRRNQIDFFKE